MRGPPEGQAGHHQVEASDLTHQRYCGQKATFATPGPAMSLPGGQGKGREGSHHQALLGTRNLANVIVSGET